MSSQQGPEQVNDGHPLKFLGERNNLGVGGDSRG